jgi:hypothetical protein
MFTQQKIYQPVRQRYCQFVLNWKTLISHINIRWNKITIFIQTLKNKLKGKKLLKTIKNNEQFYSNHFSSNAEEDMNHNWSSWTNKKDSLNIRI